MELRGSKTEKNLWEAFAGESQARNKYTYFASKAKKEGYEQISAIFTETANNEKEHAKIWFKLLMENGEIPDTLTCLKMAAAGENEEHTSMYPRMAAEAKEEGFNQVAALGSRWSTPSRRTTKSATRPWPPTSKLARSTPARPSRSGSAATAVLSISASTRRSSARSAPHPQSYFELKSSNY